MLLRRNLLKFPERVNSRDRFGGYTMTLCKLQVIKRVVRKKEREERGAVNVFFLAEKSVTRPNESGGQARVA